MFHSLLGCFFLILLHVKTQLAPIYDVSKSFYVGNGQAALSTDKQNFTITFPTGFIIQDLSYRQLVIENHFSQFLQFKS